ncbi:MAG: HlyC/CorC family transporter [Nitrospinae bacterium]|nr:HlyC/CorC family transporter [Nitrospinota bacterium]
MEEIIVIALCLMCNGMMAAYEMAFVSVPKPYLRSLAKKGDKHAQSLLYLRDNPERTLSVIQIGITLVGAIAAAIGGAGAAETIEPFFIETFGMRAPVAEFMAVALVVIPITYLGVVAGELVPKTLAMRNPAKIALAGTKWLFMADRLLAPVINILEWSTKMIVWSFSRETRAAEAPSGPVSIEIDDLSPAHQRFILNMADIENKRINDMMLQWSQVIHIRKTDSLADVMQLALSSGHTRLPVVDDGNIVGILHTKEFIAFRESGETAWQSIIRPVLKIRTTDSALGALRLMQDKRSHMAVIYSQTGERQGIVTLEDIIEVVIGDIYDEDDDEGARKIFAARARSRIRSRL